MPMTSGRMASRAARAAPISVPGSIVPVSSMVTCTWIGTSRPDGGHGPPAADHRRPWRRAGRTGSRRGARRRRPRGGRGPAPRRRRAARRSGSGRARRTWCPGPIEPATRPPWPSATSRAMRAAARLISWDRSAMPYSASGTAKAPKVAVSTTSTPTLKNSSCIVAITSGRVTTSSSLQPSRASPPKSSGPRPEGLDVGAEGAVVDDDLLVDQIEVAAAHPWSDKATGAPSRPCSQ